MALLLEWESGWQGEARGKAALQNAPGFDVQVPHTSSSWFLG